MGKSYNRNQDKYNKWDRERQQRDHARKKTKKKSGRNHLTESDDRISVSSYSDESSY
jgi:hypothetical protein